MTYPCIRPHVSTQAHEILPRQQKMFVDYGNDPTWHAQQPTQIDFPNLGAHSTPPQSNGSEHGTGCGQLTESSSWNTGNTGNTGNMGDTRGYREPLTVPWQMNTLDNRVAFPARSYYRDDTPPWSERNDQDGNHEENQYDNEGDRPISEDIDDNASDHSMTTKAGDEDRKTRMRPGFRINFDWADPDADEPPIPWEDVPAYKAFYANRVAHEFWKWDREVGKWAHIDEETGQTIYCPAELD